MYECQVCKQFARLTLKEIIRHIRDMHRHFLLQLVRCGVHNCPSTATSYESLHQHMYKKHRNELIPDHEDYNNNYSPTSTKTVHDRGHDVSHDGQHHDDHDRDVANNVDISIAEVNDNPRNMSQSTIETA